jgi:hypothetical protein
MNFCKNDMPTRQAHHRKSLPVATKHWLAGKNTPSSYRKFQLLTLCTKTNDTEKMHLYCSVVSIHHSSGLLNLSFGVDNFGKIWGACGKREIPYTKYRINNK